MALREAVARSTPQSLNAQVLAAFQLSHDIKIIDAAGAVLPIINGKRSLSLAFSTSNGDVFVPIRDLSQEGSVLMVYYAGSDLVLRAVASGNRLPGTCKLASSAAEQAGTFAEAIHIFERLVATAVTETAGCDPRLHDSDGPPCPVPAARRRCRPSLLAIG